jgi:hypothetical protein
LSQAGTSEGEMPDGVPADEFISPKDFLATFHKVIAYAIGPSKSSNKKV